jgi:hypothetical protein
MQFYLLPHEDSLPCPALPCPAPIVTQLTKAQQQQHVKTTRTKCHAKCGVNVQSPDRFVGDLVKGEAFSAALISMIIAGVQKHHTAIFCGDVDIGPIFVSWTTLRKEPLYRI